ncbi:TIGR02281 family clan AA aspartic protease [Sphingomonas sp. PB2P19]|uniref:retropepsin-like aspartic protease family protein n=1 Tax=Sphingomonas rhamnosi TaxID=3096156 RepID=UPI002FCBF78A
MPAIPDLGGNGPLYLLIAAILVAGVIARRVPVLRVVTSLAGWGVLAVLLYTLIDQRKQVDPYLGRFAALIGGDDQRVVGGEVRIRMARDGHFWARVRIGGVERRMLIDSGATITALSDTAAAEAGLKVRDGLIPMMIQTANGTIRAQTASIPELRLGAIVARDLDVVVSPAFGSTNVLGMNFLSRLKSWRVEERTLILVPHHPQKTV